MHAAVAREGDESERIRLTPYPPCEIAKLCESAYPIRLDDAFRTRDEEGDSRREIYRLTSSYQRLKFLAETRKIPGVANKRELFAKRISEIQELAKPHLDLSWDDVILVRAYHKIVMQGLTFEQSIGRMSGTETLLPSEIAQLRRMWESMHVSMPASSEQTRLVKVLFEIDPMSYERMSPELRSMVEHFGKGPMPFAAVASADVLELEFRFNRFEFRVGADVGTDGVTPGIRKVQSGYNETVFWTRASFDISKSLTVFFESVQCDKQVLGGERILADWIWDGIQIEPGVKLKFANMVTFEAGPLIYAMSPSGRKPEFGFVIGFYFTF